MTNEEIAAIYAELEATRDERRDRPPERHVNHRPKKPPYLMADHALFMLERIPYPILGDVRRVMGSRNKRRAR